MALLILTPPVVPLLTVTVLPALVALPMTTAVVSAPIVPRFSVPKASSVELLPPTKVSRPVVLPIAVGAEPVKLIFTPSPAPMPPTMLTVVAAVLLPMATVAALVVPIFSVPAASSFDPVIPSKVRTPPVVVPMLVGEVVPAVLIFTPPVLPPTMVTVFVAPKVLPMLTVVVPAVLPIFRVPAAFREDPVLPSKVRTPEVLPILTEPVPEV